MKVLSLFDGIACSRVALERAGISIEKYYASEIDKYAIQIAQKNYPDTIQLGDVKGLHFNVPRGNKFPVDLLVGGFPCVDLSIAKKNRKGLAGDKSGLFYEMIRIHKEVKPKFFLYENVSSMAKDQKELILKTIQQIDPSAYCIEINASLVSAQKRKRLFFTNIPGITQPQDKGIMLKDILEDKVDEKYYVKNVTMIEGVGNKKTELKFLGGIRNKDWAKDGKKLSRNFGQGDRVYSTDGKSTTLSALGGGRGAKTGLYAIPNKSRTIRTSGRGSGYGDKHNWDMITPIRRLTPIEAERLQGLRDNYTADISDNQRYHCLGNAFNVDVVTWILSFIPISLNKSKNI